MLEIRSNVSLKVLRTNSLFFVPRLIPHIIRWKMDSFLPYAYIDRYVYISKKITFLLPDPCH